MATTPPCTASARPQRAIQVLLGHLAPAPVEFRVQLPDGAEQSWTGGKVWPSGLALADWLAHQLPSSFMVGAKVLELGCGVAPLASAIAALRGAASVEATDGSWRAVQIASRNLYESVRSASASLPSRCHVSSLQWESVHNLRRGGAYNLILFADCVYTEKAAAVLASCIDHCLATAADSRGVYGIIPDVRVGASDFCREMQRRDFIAERLDLGPSANADNVAVVGFENCTKEDALQEGSCTLIRWRRRTQALAVVDDGCHLIQHFDRALADAELVVQDRLRLAGYVLTE
mmetsp:Transcript_5810/g.11140  ORF Transcript_5810/g.11140 Transcript_5810/m.11140 type:complete len:290 (+) Transcript_5810:66-935(+)